MLKDGGVVKDNVQMYETFLRGGERYKRKHKCSQNVFQSHTLCFIDANKIPFPILTKSSCWTKMEVCTKGVCEKVYLKRARNAYSVFIF